MSDSCFHCGESIADPQPALVKIDDTPRPMCCPGCAAVATAIVDAGLLNYYRHRNRPAHTADELVPEALRQFDVYNHPKIQSSFVVDDGGHHKEAALILEGITCPACVWLNEQYLRKLPGVHRVDINTSTLRARVGWNNQETRLSDILHAIERIGYHAHPYDPTRRQTLLERQKRDWLKRLGVAAIFGMQTMGLAISLYFDDGTMEPGIRHLIERISLLLTLPVLFYSAKPFYSAAKNDLARGQLGMDIPVTLGISLAFIASVYAVIFQQGHIYFDSVCMFTAFLLGTRLLEHSARQRAAHSAEIHNRVKPLSAHRENPDGQQEMIAAIDLSPGDVVFVRAGEVIPADGRIASGDTSVDESLLTGESRPIARRPGDAVIGGSLNIDNPIRMHVEQVGAQSVLAGIQRMVDQAQAAKPRVALLADRIASRFVMFVVLLGIFTAAYWLWQGEPGWLAITVSVLIVTCPCALSLATPAAITAGIGHLLKSGVVLSNEHALDPLTRLDHIFFDKTGTLTDGAFQIAESLLLHPDYEHSHREYASALEAHSEHVIARAFGRAPAKLNAEQVRNTPGRGLSGDIDGVRWYIGTAAYIQRQTGIQLLPETLGALHGLTQVVLANDTQGAIAAYGLSDRIRPDAEPLVQWLHTQGIRVSMLTGDHPRTAQNVADQLGIEQVIANQTPKQKIEHLQAAQGQNGNRQRVGMVGDGINDAGVLAAADCAIAVASAAPLAASGSDVLLMSPRLGLIRTAIEGAEKTQRIIRQNLIWALGYNALAVPAAVAGAVPPWMAAIGMSLSSLIVVVNALRLR